MSDNTTRKTTQEVRLVVRLSEDIMEELYAASEKSGMTRTEIARRALIAYLPKIKDQA